MSLLREKLSTHSRRGSPEHGGKFTREPGQQEQLLFPESWKGKAAGTHGGMGMFQAITM